MKNSISILGVLTLITIAFTAASSQAQTPAEERLFMNTLIVPWPDPNTPPSEHDIDVLEEEILVAKYALKNALETYLKERKKAHSPEKDLEDNPIIFGLKSAGRVSLTPDDLWLFMKERELIDARLAYWTVRRKIFERDQLALLGELNEKLALSATSLARKTQIIEKEKPSIKNRIRYNALLYRYEKELAAKEKYRSTEPAHEFSATERGFGITAGAAELGVAYITKMTLPQYLKKFITPLFKARAQWKLRQNPKGIQMSARELQLSVQSRLDTLVQGMKKNPRIAKAAASSQLTRSILRELESGAAFRRAVISAKLDYSRLNPGPKITNIIRNNGIEALIKHHYFENLKDVLEGSDRMRFVYTWEREIIRSPHYANLFKKLASIENTLSDAGRRAVNEQLIALEKASIVTSTTLEEAIQKLDRDITRVGQVWKNQRKALKTAIKAQSLSAEANAKLYGRSHPEYLKQAKLVETSTELLTKMEANYAASITELNQIKKNWKKGTGGWLAKKTPLRVLGLIASTWVTLDILKNLLGHTAVLAYEDDLKLEDLGKSYELSQNWFIKMTRNRARFFRDYRRNQGGELFWKYWNPSDILFLTYASMHSIEKTEALLEVERDLRLSETDLATIGKRNFDYASFTKALTNLKNAVSPKINKIGLSPLERKEIIAGFDSVFKQASEIASKAETSGGEIARLKETFDQLLGGLIPFIDAFPRLSLKSLFDSVYQSFETIRVDSIIPEFNPSEFSEFEIKHLEDLEKARKRSESK